MARATEGGALDAATWRRARAQFEAIEALPPAERAAARAAAAKGDAPLGLALERLAAAAAALPDTQSDPLAAGIAASIGRLAFAPQPGRRFGAFALIEEIGRGGMGTVYLAERRDGAVQQRVALKLVPQAAHDAAARARLQRERELLAALEHPHIARLIDAGEDADGVPYFAMEYVRGVPITAYCDRQRLDLRARLALLRQVCGAVQHAHANLVVHCDLKAGNILVTEEGLPKLLDFGIATSLGADAGGGARFFSPHAAAPEQFRGEASGVAVDVYALGVLLVELLAGAPPFATRGLDLDAVAQRVRHEAPPPPSRLAAQAPAEWVQARRERSAARLARRLRGDLDAIALRCLAKRPEQRYASVEALDADLGRHLGLHPISLRRGEAGYASRRFVQRHALATALAAALALALLSFAAVTLRQSQRLAIERDQAQQRERQAQFERERAEQVSAFLVDLFRASDPLQAQGHDPSARELLERGTRRLDSALGQQPALRAALLATVADIQLALDHRSEARAAATAAAGLRDTLQPPDPAAQAASLQQLARLAVRDGDFARADALMARALPALGDDAALRAEALQTAAEAKEGLNQRDAAIAAWRQALALQVAAHGADDARSLRALLGLAFALRASGARAEAQRLLADNLPRLRRALPEDDPRLGEAQLALAVFARNEGDYARAEDLAAEGLARYEKIYGAAASPVAVAANTLGTIVQARGEPARARALFERVLRIRRDLLGDAHPQTAAAEYNLGLLLLLRLHDAAAALPHLQAAADIGARTLAPQHGNLANYRLVLGSALADLDRPAAAATLRQALTAFERIAAPRGADVALARGELACLALKRGEDASAREQLAAARATLATALPGDDPQAQRVARCATSD